MKVRKVLFKASIISIICFVASVGYSSQRAAYVPGEVLVKYRESASRRAVPSLERDLGVVTIKDYPALRLSRMKIVSGVSVDECIRGYRKRAGAEIEYVEPNYIVNADILPNDPDFGELYALHNTGQDGGTIDADIYAAEAWNLQTGGSVVVAVIDTGVDYNHPDLADNIWVNEGEIPGNGIDDDGNGFIDDYRGWDFNNNDNDPQDDHSHGTHCAGTIAAVGNNGIGIAGVNWHAKIMPLKFLSSGGSGTTADAVSAIMYATMMGAKVMSNSWGGGGFSNALRDAIEAAKEAGIIFVAAAGNSAGDNDLLPHYPSSYDSENVIAVAATDRNDELASFSCYGLESVDIAAPGVSILSTAPDGGYKYSSGTSMATPHVAGAAALAMAHWPSSSSEQIISAILDGSDPLSSLEGMVATGGRLNVSQMLNPENDTTAPARITDLSLAESRMSRVTLQWTSTGDDGNTGMANCYDLRYSLEPIVESNWGAASLASDLPSPQYAGSVEKVTVTGLLPATDYYFAIKAKDNRKNSSPISNLVYAATSDGTLVMKDDVEGAGENWSAEGLWHRTSHRASSGSRSRYYGQEGIWNYDTGGVNSGTLTSEEIDLTIYRDAVLVFDHYREVEFYGGPYDICSVEVSSDGGVSWEVLWQMDSSHPFEAGWNSSGAVMLTDIAGERIRLRFSFDTVDNSGNNYEGWYVDNIRVLAEQYHHFHDIELILNKERFAAGDELDLTAVVTRSPLSQHETCDGYLAVLDPAGRTFFLNGNYKWSPAATPFVRDFWVRDLTAHLGPFIVSEGLAEGDYTVFAVLTDADSSALRAANWASPLEKADFTISR